MPLSGKEAGYLLWVSVPHPDNTKLNDKLLIHKCESQVRPFKS